MENKQQHVAPLSDEEAAEVQGGIYPKGAAYSVCPKCGCPIPMGRYTDHINSGCKLWKASPADVGWTVVL